MKFNFKNKNVFISGGTHGIGLACLLKFAEMGSNVVTFSRDEKKIINVKKKLKKFKVASLIDKGDILDESFVEKFAYKVIKKFKKIDILIHNVGGGGRWGNKEFLLTKKEVWYQVYKKNVEGVITFSKIFLPLMLKKKWGRIIAIGSVTGIEAKEEDRPWFNAAKSAQHSIIKSLSKKRNYTNFNITFNSISPGPIFIKNTGWDKLKKDNKKEFYDFIKNNIPTGKMGNPEDVANLCAFLSSDYASYINGANIVIDGGSVSSIK